MWVMDAADNKIYAYNLATKARDAAKESGDAGSATSIDVEADTGNYDSEPLGIWSDGTTMWTVRTQGLDENDEPLAHDIYAFDMETWARVPSKDFILHADNEDPVDLWSDGDTVWVTDFDAKIYAYKMSNQARDPGKDFDTADLDPENTSPNYLWSDGETLWVQDESDDALYAHNLRTKTRDVSQDYPALDAENTGSKGIWSDGEHMWASDSGDDKLYAYVVPRPACTTGVASTNFNSSGTYTDRDDWSAEFTRSDARSGSYACYYTFTLAAEEEVNILLESTAANAYLLLRRGSAIEGPVLAFNDNINGDTLNARISRVLSAGTYTIEATTRDPGETGGFTLKLAKRTLLAPGAVPEGETCDTVNLTEKGITNGHWLDECKSSGEYTSGTAGRYYDFHVTGRRNVAITLSSVHATPRLILRYGANNHRWGIVGYGAYYNLRDSRLSMTLEEGSYTIEAFTNEPGQRGAFSLTVSGSISAAPDPASLPDPVSCDASPGSSTAAAAATLLAGETASGEWGPGCFSTTRGNPPPYTRYYTFALDTRSTVVITAQATSGDRVAPALMLRRGVNNRSGYIVTQDHPDSGNRSRITLNLAPGTYVVEVASGTGTTFGGVRVGGTGTFTVGYTARSFTPGCSPRTIRENVAVNGEWWSDCAASASGQYAAWYTFRVTGRDARTMAIRLETTYGPGPALYLRQGANNTSGAHLAYNDYHRNSSVAQITRSLEPGYYTIEAATSGQPGEGNFTLTLGSGPACGHTITETGEVSGEWYGRCAASPETNAGRWTPYSAAYYTFTVTGEAAKRVTIDIDTKARGVLRLREGADNRSGAALASGQPRHVAARDFTTLDAGNGSPEGLWSDGITMWVADIEDDKIYAYKMSDMARDPDQDFNTLSGAGNTNPRGIWSNGETMWVADNVSNKLFAYQLNDGTRDAGKDFNTLSGAGNTDLRGIWSDGYTMYVADAADVKAYAYRMSTRQRRDGADISYGSSFFQSRGMWSDGVTMWVADNLSDKLFAYQLNDGTRDGGKDFNTLSGAGNTNPSGIWSDGTTTWIADYGADKLYAYAPGISMDLQPGSYTIEAAGMTWGRFTLTLATPPGVGLLRQPDPEPEPTFNSAPNFDANVETTLSLPENSAAGTNVGAPITATDSDGDELTYSLSGADAASFSINAGTGQLTTAAGVEYDYESKAEYSLGVSADDGQGIIASILVTVNLTDVNEAPAFGEGSSAARQVAENSAGGVNVGAPITATDPEGDELYYLITGPDSWSFEINWITGQLSTLDYEVYDYESKSEYSLIVSAAAANGGTASIPVTVTLTAVDEGETPPDDGAGGDGGGTGESNTEPEPPANRAPTFDAGSGAGLTVAENSAAGTNVGAPITATDPDDGDTLTYSLSGADAASFSINTATGQLTTRSGVTYNYEAKSAYSLAVSAADGKGLSASIPVTVNLTDVDEAPTVSDTSQFKNHDTRVGQAFNLFLPAADANSGDGGPYEYLLWHRGQGRNFMDQAVNGLRFDPATRELSGTPEAAGVYRLSYVVHDNDANRSVADRFRARTNLQITVSQ